MYNLPKFRAFIIAEKRTEEVVAINFKDNHITTSFVDNYVTMHMDNFILMQSTGLTDVNGKEIFESDLISFENGSGLLHEIVWDNEKLYWAWNKTIKGNFVKNMKVKIIGNVYEHHELVGK